MSTSVKNTAIYIDQIFELWSICFDFKWYEDIAEALKFNQYTALNKWCLTQELIIKMNRLKEFTLEDLWFIHYELIEDNLERSIEKLKRSWVIHIMSVNDFWDINIRPINWHFNQLRSWHISRSSFLWRYELPYVLLYDRRPLVVEAQLLASQVSSAVQEMIK